MGESKEPEIVKGEAAQCARLETRIREFNSGASHGEGNPAAERNRPAFGHGAGAPVLEPERR